MLVRLSMKTRLLWVVTPVLAKTYMMIPAALVMEMTGAKPTGVKCDFSSKLGEHRTRLLKADPTSMKEGTAGGEKRFLTPHPDFFECFKTIGNK